MSRKPTWYRMQCGHWRDQAIHRLNQSSDRTRAAVALYHASIAYAHEELTDGWVSPSFPTLAGFGKPHTQVLVDHGLWIPNEIAPHLGGWLIHNYLEYQPSRAEWIDKGLKAAASAKARWNRDTP